MTTILRLSVRIYAAVLPLYPAELRRDFGLDMEEAFAEDLADALQRRRVSGAVRVWHQSFRELLRIALPGQMENPAIAVPFIIFALCETLLSSELLLAFSHRPAAMADSPVPLGAIPVAVLLPSLIAAITAFAAIRAGNRSLPFRLGLSSN